MPATDLAEVFQLEYWMETGMKEALSAGSIITPSAIGAEAIFISRESNSEVTARVEIKCVVKGSTSQGNLKHQHIFPDGRRWAYDGFTGELRVMPVTNRAKGQRHTELLGRVRANLQMFVLNPNQMNGLLGTFKSPILNLANIFESDTSDTWADDENCDYTELVYGILFSIRPDAWPLNI